MTTTISVDIHMKDDSRVVRHEFGGFTTVAIGGAAIYIHNLDQANLLLNAAKEAANHFSVCSFT